MQRIYRAIMCVRFVYGWLAQSLQMESGKCEREKERTAAKKNLFLKDSAAGSRIAHIIVAIKMWKIIIALF